MSLLKNELKKAVDKLGTLDPSSHEYGVCLGCIEILVGNGDFLDDAEKILEQPEVEVSAVGVQIIESDETCKADEDTGAQMGMPEIVKASDFVATPVVDTRTFDASEVRAALVEARKQGVNITEVLQEFGVDNFGAFPAGRYGELMDRIGRG